MSFLESPSSEAGDNSFHEKVNDVIDRPENAGGGGKCFGNCGFIGHIDLPSPGGEEVQEDLLDRGLIELRTPYQVGSIYCRHPERRGPPCTSHRDFPEIWGPKA